ncbi:YqkE family protein [Aquibacillus albus]|uniref:DUF3886 domain-containing protein n=1 Tax=Aquibacillus albus TaxID=1168171 RepID=A0ABS2MV33_9BACI|nr:YqkE family protein [Aquibacillus albus]MBM7569754.1 hypothetical protein [Aquibacillus albus]
MSRRKKEKDEFGHSLKERLSGDILSQLSSKKGSLKREEEQKKDRKRKEKIEARKRKEANKSFEQLLEESELDWKKFK